MSSGSLFFFQTCPLRGTPCAPSLLFLLCCNHLQLLCRDLSCISHLVMSLAKCKEVVTIQPFLVAVCYRLNVMHIQTFCLILAFRMIQTTQAFLSQITIPPLHCLRLLRPFVCRTDFALPIILPLPNRLLRAIIFFIMNLPTIRT